MSTLHAIYDLKYCPESFDFFVFLSIALNIHDDVKVIFAEGKKDKRKFSDEETKRRIESILIPGCELLGIPFEFRKDRNFDYSFKFPFNWPNANGKDTYMVSKLLQLYGGARKFSGFKFPSVEKKENRITITLRDYGRNKYRNSNISAWKEFAEYAKQKYEVVVLEDFGKTPISLVDRVNLYSSSKMNLFVNNGPAVLCCLSDLPYMVFKMESRGSASIEHLNDLGMDRGFQYPWHNRQQKIIWENDDFEVIKHHVDEFMEINCQNQ